MCARSAGAGGPFTRKRLLELAGRYDARSKQPVSGGARPTAHPKDVTSIDLLCIRRGMIKGSRAEIKCDACNGSGSLPVREPEPGRKIYPGRGTKCARKGRIPKPE